MGHALGNNKPLFNGLKTGLFLQLAVGPVFFFIINLALQRSIWHGLVAVIAVTMVDFFYISLSIFGVGKFIEKEKFKKIFGIVSSLILVVFGVMIAKSAIQDVSSNEIQLNSGTLFSSFFSVLMLTITNPMTIIFLLVYLLLKRFSSITKRNNFMLLVLG